MLPQPPQSRTHTLLRWISGLAALPALLIPFRAPTHLLWMLRVGATEWGHYSTFVVASLFIRPFRQMLGPWLHVVWGIAAGTLLQPLMRAIPIARRLPAELAAAFGQHTPMQQPNAPTRSAPLVLTDLIGGIALVRQKPERVQYALHAEQPLVFDFYRAQPPGVAPLVVVIHGGAWQSGDPTQLPDLNDYLATRGYAVASISYRLAPQHQFPAAYQDVLAAIAFLKQQADDYRIDPTRIVLLGRSAGGHLALLAGYCSTDLAIRGVVSFYGPTDMHFAWNNPVSPRVIDTRGVLRAFLGGSPTEQPEQYYAASPINFVGPHTPPTLLIHGTTDELVRFYDSHALAAVLKTHGCPHYLLELPWATHGCDANLSGPSGQLSTYAVERFLAACCASSV